MDERYEAYCLADPFFYDHPAVREDLAPPFAHTRRPPPPGWSAGPAGDWWQLAPDAHRMPRQGWQIHVSATPGSAAAVLDALYPHCFAATLPFEHLRSGGLLFLRNSKHAERGSSGRFATLYPAEEAELERTLKQLDDALSGQPGPSFLSGLRYGKGPLYVSYGGPGARFAPPPWAALPGFLAAHLEARLAATAAGMVADLPYRIEKTLRSSDGGCVYQGTDTRAGTTVVIKEARAHAGLLRDGRDAIARLGHERAALARAAGSGAGPAVLDWVEAGERRFLVLEHIPGRTLDTLFAERYPLIGRDPQPGACAAYAAWALGIARKVQEALEALHAHGVVFDDLDLRNVMVLPDGSVRLIGFESAAPSGPGTDRYALASLRLALFLPLTTLLPLDRTRARALADAVRGEFPEVPDLFLDEAVAVIAAAGPAARPAPAPAFAAAGASAGGLPGVDAPLARVDWNALRASIGAGIALSASPQRTDRLFPGDVDQFAHAGSGAGFAHGAAGVLYALHATGAPIPPAYVDWLVRRGGNPGADARLGFYDGVHGVAYVLDLLGRRESAHRLLARAVEERWQRLGPDLSGGLAGIGLNLLHFAERTGDAGLRGAALEAGRLAGELLAQQDGVRARGTDGPRAGAACAGAALEGRAGLLHGASGTGLLFLRLYESSGDADWLDRARAALRLDLARCIASERDGSLRVSRGRRAVPYLAEGSAGIALVARRYLAHREDEALRRAVAAIDRACTSRFYARSGLFAGRAGMLLALADADTWTAAAGAWAEAAAPSVAGSPGLPPRRGMLPGPASYPAARTRPRTAGPAAGEPPRGGPEALDQLRRLTWHAVDLRGKLAFPGDRLHRLSMDLATGGAGVLLALGAVLGDAPTHLPFLGPPSVPRGAVPAPAPAGRTAP